MNSTKRIALWAAVMLNIIILFLLLVTGSGSPFPLRLTSVPSPEDTVEQFFRCVSARDFDGADELVANYSSLGLARQTTSDSDIFENYLYDGLLDSYSVESTALPAFADTSATDVLVSPSDLWRSQTVIYEEEYDIDGSSASVRVRYTCLDSAKLTARLAEIAAARGKALAESGTAVDNDDAARILFDQAAQELMNDDPRRYYTTNDIEIELVYTDGAWKIIANPELCDAMLGKFESAPAQQPAVSGGDMYE